MLNFVQKLFKKKIKNYQKLFDYISKYSYVFDKNNATETVSGYEDCIWQFWWQGKDNAPLIVKKCMESVEKFYPNKVIVIDKDNYSKYVEIPQYIIEKLEKKEMGLAHFSDILRVYLLTKYGGTWIDTTVYLSDKIPSDILNADFFMFKSTAWALCPTVPSNDMLRVLDSIPHYLGSDACSSWFIHSKPNNLILNTVKSFLNEYWKKETCLVNYFLFHYILTFVLMNNEDCAKILETMPNKNNRNPHLLANVLYSEFNEDLFDEIKIYSSIHKLTYKKPKADKEKNLFIDEIVKG